MILWVTCYPRAAKVKFALTRGFKNPPYMAAMRKLVHLCFGVLKSQTPYQANYANIA